MRVKWLSEMSEPKALHCLALCADKIYAFCGIADSEVLSNVCMRYDRSKNKWESIPPCNTLRKNAFAVVEPVTSVIYIVGGNNNN
mmetsp:Transcript_4104/g.2377  ORF Transcript_4104/g.2377 Transcript_4104/m.2377 type:complete len:85 (+) Transcript_4104:108-362(+)